MSFNATGIAAPFFLIAAVVLCALAPGFVEEGAASWAFWIAAGVGTAFFLFLYLPLAMDQGDPGTGFCCGVILIGPCAALAWYQWEPHPVARALIPWGTLLSGPLVVVGLALVEHVTRRAKEVAARRSLIRIARGGSREELLPFLLDPNPTIRAAALAQLSAFPDGPAADAALLGACFEGYEKRSGDVADQLTVRVLERGSPSREDLLALYRLAPSHVAADALERCLTALAWDDHAPLLAAARQRIARPDQRNVDRVVHLLLEENRPAALDLAGEAVLRFALRAETLLAIGVPDVAPVLEHALASMEAGEEVYEAPLVGALLQLPVPFALPWLTRLLGCAGRNVDMSLSGGLRDHPAAFAGADEAPEAAAALLKAVEQRRALPENTPAERSTWERVAQAVRMGLGEEIAPAPPAPAQGADDADSTDSQVG